MEDEKLPSFCPLALLLATKPAHQYEKSIVNQRGRVNKPPRTPLVLEVSDALEDIESYMEGSESDHFAFPFQIYQSYCINVEC